MALTDDTMDTGARGGAGDDDSGGYSTGGVAGPGDADSAGGGSGSVDDGGSDLGGTAPSSDDDDDPVGGGGGGYGSIPSVGPDPEPDPPSVDELRSEIGGAVGDVRDTVSDVGEGVRDRVDDVRDTADDVGEGVRDRVDGVRDTVSDVGEGVRDRVGDVTGPNPRVRDRTVERAPEPAEFDSDSGGDTGGGSDTTAPRRAPEPARFDPDADGPDVVPDPFGLGRTAPSRAEERAPEPARFDTDAPDVDAPERITERARANPPDEEITDDLTRGGLLSETREGDSGLLPGELFGADLSEERLRGAAEETTEARRERFKENPELTVGGSDLPDRFLTGAARDVASPLTNPAGLALGAETATEVATSLPGEVREEGAGDVAATAGGVALGAAASQARFADRRPAEFAGGAVFGLVAGAGAGRAVGSAGRGVSDRVRTAGGTEVELDNGAVRFAETDGAEGERFPSADDPGLFRSDPAQAVREQADRAEPEAVDNVFGAAGVDDGTTLTKALDTEPEGPRSGRADQGFRSAPEETADDFDFETPGSFFGPELSPNFLRTGGGDASLSPIPGLPDFGNRPTAVMARTDVENPDADDLEGFNEEMIDRSGETTARPKPPSEVNPGEIEAVVPPGAEFAPVGSGGLRGVGRRLGIGSELFTAVDGRRVPIRTVAPSDRIDSDDTAGAAGRGAPDAETGSLSSYARAPGDPVDRALPVGGPSPFGEPLGGGSSVSAPGSGRDGGGSSPPRGGGASSLFGGTASASSPGSDSRPPASSSPTSSPSGSSTPAEPMLSPFGSVSVGSPTSGAPTSAPAEPATSPTVGLPGAPSQPQRRRRDERSRTPDPDRQRIGRDDRDPANTPFTNPILGVGAGIFGGGA